MTTIWTGFGKHRYNGIKRIRCYSRLDLTPLRDQSCASRTPAICTESNISLLVHDSHTGIPFPSWNSSYFRSWMNRN
ncbi:hypothetical protein V6N13_046261 [Hibiscus sabdariffa]|uniref:Uncharacterized protein n=1 Tax=Hibiscus sabdariffa TaxID=183260 RepID=A0ABR2D9L7_9ROSI